MNAKRARRHPPSVVLGPLPINRINKGMGTELEPGMLIVPAGMDVHVSRKRPGEYARLLPHLGAVTANPLYAGDDFKNEGIEIIGSAPGSGGEFILIAICLTLDNGGNYQVRTFYSITDEKIQQRRRKGVLNVLP